MKKLIIMALPFALAACQANKAQELNYVQPNHVITKTVVKIPEPKVKTSFGYQADPAILKAYDEFSKTGAMPSLSSEGFLTFAYDGRSHFVIACEPLHLCVVQLEEGENINNIDIGDAANWLVSTSLVGTLEKGAYQVTIKPKRYDIATDLVVTTTRRTYNLGLVSKSQAKTHIVNFYYPLESLQDALQQAQQLKSETLSDAIPKLIEFTILFLV